MGFWGSIGDAFSSAGNAIAHTAESAGNSIANTAKSGANTVANGVEDGLAAIDPERQKQREHMQQAQQEWTRLDNMANMALRAAEAQAQTQIAAQLDPIKAQANTFSQQLTQYLAEIDTMHNDLQTKVEQEYEQVIFNLVDGFQCLTRLAMIFRGHSVEDIRAAKLANTGSMDPNDFLLQVVNGSRSSFSNAMDSATALLSLVGGMTVQARDLNQSEIPNLLANMTTFGKFSAETVTGYRKSAVTAQGAINNLQKAIQEQKQEVTDHLHMNITDDLAGLGKAFLGLFGQSFPDDWDQFLQSHYANIQNYNTGIVQNQTTAAVANGIVEQATPIINDVIKLQQQTANTIASLQALSPGLETLKANLNGLKLQVDDIAEVFSTIAESTHFDMSTAEYVKKLAEIAASSARIDACCQNCAGYLIGQLMQIVIPKSNLAASELREGGNTQADPFADWRAALRLPLQCSLPPINGKEHVHFFPEVQSQSVELGQEIATVTQNGFDKYYTP